MHELLFLLQIGFEMKFHIIWYKLMLQVKLNLIKYVNDQEKVRGSNPIWLTT